MKKQFLLLLSLSCSILVVAQPAFNKKELFQYGSNIFSNLIVRGDKIFVSGLAVRNVKPHTYSGGFGTLSLNGDSLLSVSYIDTLGNPSWWDDCMVETYNGNFLIAGDLPGASLILQIDSNGTILRHKKFYNYYYPKQSWTNTDVLYQDSDSLIWLITNSYKNNDEIIIQINKFNQSLDSITTAVVGASDLLQSGKSFVKLNDNRYLIAGSYFHVGFSNLRPGDFFIEVDKNGKLLSQYYLSSSLNFGGMGAMLVEPSDSSYIMFGSLSYEVKFDIYGYLYLYPMVYKLDKNKNVVWKTMMGNGSYNVNNWMYKIQEANEQDGYVFAGNLWAPGKDSLGFQQVYGTFGKVAKNGDSLWLRKYSCFDEGEVWGDIYDIQPAPDGGYYLSGSSTGGPKPEHQYQGGWILKVDQYGCLVPNCHLSTALPTLPNTEIHYSIYPNPTTDRVNVFVKDAEARPLDLKLYNNNGQLLKSVEHSGEVNYTLSLESYPSGVYFLNFLQEGRLLHSEKIVKQ